VNDECRLSPGRTATSPTVAPQTTRAGMIRGYAEARTLETTEEDRMNTVFPHPTISEALHEAVPDACGRVIHI
jgi:dihydrolipoamide dehydrogenase